MENGELIKAIEYFESVLRYDADNNTALLKLAVIYLRKHNDENTLKMGKKYLKKAAENGNGKAMFNLGCCYANFKGVYFPTIFPFSLSDAIYWLERAEKAGVTEAREKLKLLKGF